MIREILNTFDTPFKQVLQQKFYAKLTLNFFVRAIIDVYTLDDIIDKGH